VTEREQQLFDLGDNFPGLLTDEELAAWRCLRDRLETEPSESEQDQWSAITILASVFLAVIAVVAA